MTEITLLLQSLGNGQTEAADRLLGMVYDQLRRIAAQKMMFEAPGNTLQATALVHEAWLNLVGEKAVHFENRAQFFAAAAEAMRRILVDSARRKLSLKRGSGARPEEIREEHWVEEVRPDELLAVHEAVVLLERNDEAAAKLVKLRYFAGMTMDEAAEALEMPLRTAERTWAFAKAWLRKRIEEQR